LGAFRMELFHRKTMDDYLKAFQLIHSDD